MAELTEKQWAELLLVPYIPEGYSWFEHEEGKITVEYPSTYQPSRIFAKLTGKTRMGQRKLDVHGSYIYPLIDGKRTIRELADLMGERFGDEVEPLYERFLEYCGMLWRNRLIEITGQDRK